MPPDNQTPQPGIQSVAPEIRITPPPSDSWFKMMASLCVLALIMGFAVDTSKTGHSVATNDASVIGDKDGGLGIDSSFFSLNQPVAVPPEAPQPPIAIKPAQAPTPADFITADSYLVGNLATGKIYFEKDPTAVRPIASISKLITGMVIQKNLDPNALVAIASSSVTGYEQVGDVHPGETFSENDLLAGMLLISSNDAALAFANDYGYPAFISLMKTTAQSLGMSQTSFIDPSGLSPGNVSTADDLFILAKYLYADDPGLLAITKMPRFDVATTTTHDNHDFLNIDPFAYDPHYIGGKTGRSDVAGETMLSMFNLPINGVLNPIAIIVLHSDQDSRQTDSSILVGKVLGLISGQ